MKPLDLSDDAVWKARFRTPLIHNSQVAAINPQHGLVSTNLTGAFQLYAWEVESGDLRQLTDVPTGKQFGGISPDGEYIYYLGDDGGNEIGHYVRVPFAGGQPQDITPDMPPYSSNTVAQSLNGRLLGFMTATRDGFIAHLMDANPDGTFGTVRQLYKSQRLSSGPTLSYDGRHAVVMTTERSQYREFSLLAFDLEDAEQQPTRILQDEEGSVMAVAFAPVDGDSRLLAMTDASGYRRPLIWDVATGDRTDIPLNDLSGDVTPWDWSPDGEKILLLHTHQAVEQLYIYEMESSTLRKLDHPSGTFYSAYFVTADEIFVNWEDATHTRRVIALDASTGQQTRVALQVGDKVPPSTSWRSVTFQSTGQAQIQAWLATPEGDGPFPTILNIHGGPTGVQFETFDPKAQAWLDHGFAWISVNYRGSTTFGREFEQSIYGMLGHREVDDMAAAVAWLIENGISQPDAIFSEGRSYGGYLTLQALGKRPDLWAGGLAMVAIGDWNLMYEDQAESLRGYQVSLFGGTPDELPEQHKASSPITYAENVDAPLLVIQGRNDTRCPARQLEVYEAKLRELGKDIHVHWYDAGHAAMVIEKNIEWMEMQLRFVYRVLGQ